MRIIRLLMFVVMFLIPTTSSNADAKTVNVGLFKWEPLIVPGNSEPGLLTEITIKSLEKMGYSVKIRSATFKRILHLLKNGDLDAAPGISLKDDRKSYLNFTPLSVELGQGFIFKKGKINYSSINDLKNSIGGVLRGSFWEKELSSAGINIDVVHSQVLNAKKLIADRIDFMCMPKYVGFHLLKSNGADTEKYDFGIYKSETQYLGVSKKSANKKLHLDFSKGLKLIKEDGTFASLLSKYK